MPDLAVTTAAPEAPPPADSAVRDAPASRPADDSAGDPPRSEGAECRWLAENFRKELDAAQVVMVLPPPEEGRSHKARTVSPPASPSRVPAAVVREAWRLGEDENVGQPVQDWTGQPLGLDGAPDQFIHTLLVVARNARKQLLAVVLVSADVPFDHARRERARSLAEAAGRRLEALRTHAILRAARDAVGSAADPAAGREAVLRCARRLWPRTLVQLIETSPDLRPDTPVRVVVPVQIPDPTGSNWVLVAERSSSFDEFDDGERMTLRAVANHAPDGAAAPADPPADLTGPAQTLAQTVLNRVGFRGGLVYTVVPRSRALHAIAGWGTSEACRVSDIEPWVFPLEVANGGPKSAAVLGYESKDREAMWTDPWAAIAGEVSVKGLDEFAIAGSLIAVPLAYKGEDRTDRLGAVVFWTDERLSEADLAKMYWEARALAEAEAEALHVALYTRTRQRQYKLLAAVARVRQQMLIETDLRVNLGAIMWEIARLAFARVRVYEFRYSNRFVGYMSHGMDDATAAKFTGIELLVVDEKREGGIAPNHYAKKMFDGVCKARRMAQAGAEPVDRDNTTPTGPGGPTNELLARVHYPVEELIADECRQLGKNLLRPWAEVPVLMGGKLYGMIAADYHDGTRREPRDDDLEVLDAFAGLAAEAFQMHEQHGVLRNLEDLHESVGLDQRDAHVYRRVLLFAAHGEGGLGFSRAAFFAADPGNPLEFRFLHAVGSTSEASFFEVAARTYKYSLNEALQIYDPGRDDIELNTELAHRRVTLTEADALNQPCVVQYDNMNRASPAWADGCHLPGGKVALVVPVHYGAGRRGLLVVDRAWQHQWEGTGYRPDDVLNLTRFARHVGMILTQLTRVRAQQTIVQGLHGYVGHELRRPMESLRTAVTQLKQNSRKYAGLLADFARDTTQAFVALNAGLAGLTATAPDAGYAPWRTAPPAPVDGRPAPVAGVESVFRPADAELDRLDSALKGFELIADVEKSELPPVPAAEFQGWIDDICVEFDHVAPPAGPAPPDRIVRANRVGVQIAVRNLIRNACEAVARNPTPHCAEVCVRVTWVMDPDRGQHVEVTVTDTGTGLTDIQASQFEAQDLVVSGKEKGRPGLGLYITVLLARRHDGDLHFSRSEGRTHASLWIPITGVTR